MKKILSRTIYTVIVLTIAFALAGVAYATNCWDNTLEINCVADNDCNWKEDPWGGWCEEKGCWNYWSEDTCSQADNSTNTDYYINKTCSWSNSASSWCMELQCWAFEGTNESACVNNSRGLECEWELECDGPPEKECWNYGTEDACADVAGCEWGGCFMMECMDYSGTTRASCEAAIGYNGQNCKWSAQYQSCQQSGCNDYTNITGCQAADCKWEGGYCYEYWCSDFSRTNQSNCENNAYNLTCQYNGDWCEERGCWNFNTQNNCDTSPECYWESQTGGWCEQVECWSFDNYSAVRNGLATTNASYCINNSGGLDCAYDANGGWCYEDVASKSCTDLFSERDCMDTFYCFWNFTGGTCKEPQIGTIETDFNEWNPGCYIFDMDQNMCVNTTGCFWNSTDTACGTNITIIPDEQLNCTLLTNQTLCNDIPMLSTCCQWQAGSCVSDKFDNSCRNEMEEPPEGSYYCEDYVAYTNKDKCVQIAGGPWYMPCKWNNNSERCEFKEDDVYGTGEKNIMKLDNKQNCIAAGGVWLTEKYCQGDSTLSMGRCEMKFDQSRTCDKDCFACNYKPDKTNWSSATDAKLACVASAIGFCNFEADSSAKNGLGKCKPKEEMKNMKNADCNTDCSTCTYKGDPSASDSNYWPSTYCGNSKAKCQWIADPAYPSDQTKGRCAPEGEKTCEDSCNKCYEESDCISYGGKEGDSSTDQTCKWQQGICVLYTGGDEMEICWNGEDDNADGKIDCADSMCFSDSFCGFVTGDCPGYGNDETACLAANCTWMNEDWGSWCDMPGADCWKNDGTNTTYCQDDGANNDTCEWHSGFGGFCEEDWNKGASCMGKNSSQCAAAAADNCTWVADEWCENGGGLCDPDWSYTGNDWYDCPQHDSDGEQVCETHAQCNWYVDSWCEEQVGNPGYCDHKSFACWQYDDGTACTNTSNDNDDFCVWMGDWCEGKMMSGGETSCWNQQDESTCTTAGCNWMSGFCDPKGFGGEMMPGGGGMGGFGVQCFMYDGNQSGCTNQTGCGWFEEQNPFCDVDFSSNCPQYSYNGTICNQQTNCKYNPEGGDGVTGGFCDEQQFECFWNMTLKDQGNDPDCISHPLCNWDANMGCTPTCFSQSTSGDCTGTTGCKWVGGWCNPGGASDMFEDMKGEPIILGIDTIGDASLAEVDIMDVGMKEMGDSFAFGISVNSMADAAICNGVKLMSGTSGTGTNTTKFYWYLDTDGDATNNCDSKDSNRAGFEFFFSYVATYDNTTGNVNEVMTREKCTDDEWTPAEIPTFNLKQFMCTFIGGGMIGIDKGELEKYSDLYTSTADLRVYAATANATANATDPTDYMGNVGYATQGAFDFSFDDFNIFKSQTDVAKNANKEDSMGSGGIQMYSEVDCWTQTGCSDWACLNHPYCVENSYGVHSATFTDTKIPKIAMMYLETYSDSAFMAFFTDKPANYSYKFYRNDSKCGTLNTTIRDSDFDFAHKVEIYNGANSLAYDLDASTQYYFKIEICDSNGKCGGSACSSFTTEPAASCGFCDFVTRIDPPSGWQVEYDLNTDGTYEHVQGQVCSSDAGMKTNYTNGRSANIKLVETDNSSYMEFVGVRLTKSGLRPNARDINDAGDLTGGTSNSIGYVGMIEETRDQIVNNLFPEQCYIKIPGSGTCSALWHCDNDFGDCVDRSTDTDVTLNATGADYCIWQIPCEFSVWAGGDLSVTPSSPSNPSSPGGSSGTSTNAPVAAGAIPGDKKVMLFLEVVQGNENRMNINLEGLTITKNYFRVDKDLASVKVSVVKVESAEAAATIADAYQYIEITTQGASNSDISEAIIEFRVEKAWLADYNEDSVALNLYDGSWSKLPTTKGEEEGDYIYYQAATSDFATFAVTAEKTVVETANEGEAETLVETVKEGLNGVTGAVTGGKGIALKPIHFIFAGLIVGITLLVVWLTRKVET